MSAAAILAAGAVLAGLGVAAGAFGAHALKQVLSPADLAIFETAVRYQMYHALALLGVGLWQKLSPAALLGVAAGLFIAGVILFSGSLYVLVASQVRAWGAVTPLGGLCFIAGWVCLTLVGLRAGAV